MGTRGFQVNFRLELGVRNSLRFRVGSPGRTRAYNPAVNSGLSSSSGAAHIPTPPQGLPAKAAENSEVFPFASVAVAVIEPLEAAVTLQLQFPEPLVVHVVPAR